MEHYGKMLAAYSRNRATLGKAVNPGALTRLHELYPEARVKIRHEHAPVELPKGTQRMSMRYYVEPEHITRIFIDLNGDGSGNKVFGMAVCHPEDNYERRRGIELAFRRALDAARKRYNPVAWQAAKDANKKKGKR